MKIMHTADWHLGKIVNGVHMTEDQEHILHKLLDMIEHENPDVLIIAGDLYDRAIPPRDAVELLNHILTTIITKYKIPILAITGNHDSPDRLEFGTKLFREQNLYLQAKLSKDLTPIIIHDEAGPVYFHLIPYIEPEEAREIFDDESIQTHQDAMAKIVTEIENRHDMSQRHVLIGHAFVAGGMESESEERLSMVGGSPYVEASIFKNFSYIALGHLHQAQRVTNDKVRYSGSILKYSFSEANHHKSVTMVDLAADQSITYHYLPLIPKRDLKVIEGFFTDLYNEPLANAEDYLQVILLDDGQIIDAMSKLRQRYPNILRLERKRHIEANSLNELESLKEEREKSPAELFARFYKQIKGTEIDELKLNYFKETVDSLIKRERSD